MRLAGDALSRAVCFPKRTVPGARDDVARTNPTEPCDVLCAAVRCLLIRPMTAGSSKPVHGGTAVDLPMTAHPEEGDSSARIRRSTLMTRAWRREAPHPDPRGVGSSFLGTVAGTHLIRTRCMGTTELSQRVGRAHRFHVEHALANPRHRGGQTRGPVHLDARRTEELPRCSARHVHAGARGSAPGSRASVLLFAQDVEPTA